MRQRWIGRQWEAQESVRTLWKSEICFKSECETAKSKQFAIQYVYMQTLKQAFQGGGTPIIVVIQLGQLYDTSYEWMFQKHEQSFIWFRIDQH